MKLTPVIKILVSIPALISMSLSGELPGASLSAPAAEPSKPAVVHSLADNHLGSSEDAEGNIVVVSAFVSDSQISWDMSKSEDKAWRDKIHGYMEIAEEWFESSAESYDVDADLIWDWEKDEDLICYPELDGDLIGTFMKSDEMVYKVWDYIGSSIDSDKLLNKYDSDSILYMFFMNTAPGTDFNACTVMWDESRPILYEFCVIPTRSLDYDLTPGVIAHELLHTFGAPDLYGVAWEYGITERFTLYSIRYKLGDIMLMAQDPRTFEFYEDRIVNKITDVTAYYIGWTESSETVDYWHFGKSQHEKLKKRLSRST